MPGPASSYPPSHRHAPASSYPPLTSSYPPPTSSYPDLFRVSPSTASTGAAAWMPGTSPGMTENGASGHGGGRRVEDAMRSRNPAPTSSYPPLTSSYPDLFRVSPSTASTGAAAWMPGTSPGMTENGASGYDGKGSGAGMAEEAFGHDGKEGGQETPRAPPIPGPHVVMPGLIHRHARPPYRHARTCSTAVRFRRGAIVWRFVCCILGAGYGSR